MLENENEVIDATTTDETTQAEEQETVPQEPATRLAYRSERTAGDSASLSII